MLFSSLQFFIFLPIVFLVYHVIPTKIRYIWLLVSSYYFYMCWNPKYVLLLLCSTVVTYIAGLFLESFDEQNKDIKKLTVFLCVFINLAILFFFKYYGFTANTIDKIFSLLHISTQVKKFDVILPVGISFYTFQALGYIVDVYRKDTKAEKNFFRYALFVSFFPQLVAGPIERSGNLLSQLRKPKKLTYDDFREGFYLLIYGYFIKLVIADRAGIFVDTVYNSVSSYDGVYFIVATIFFSLQIYCDFYGYSVIAKGCGKLMGINLMENFNAPYLSRSIAEFWRKWHISLSSWLRDYLYIPLGGNRKGVIRQCINLMIVFFISGLWHGAAWTFVIWGCLHGAYQIFGKILKPLKQALCNLLSLHTDSFGHKCLQIVVTYILTTFAWIFFRANSVNDAFDIIKSMIKVRNPWILFDGSLFECGLNDKNFRVLVYAAIVLLIADILKLKGYVIREKLLSQDFWFRWIVLIAGIILTLVFGIWGSGYDTAGFIYFQF